MKAIRVFVRETANGRFPKPIKMKIKQIVIGENLWREKGCPSAKKICARLYTKTIIMYNDILRNKAMTLENAKSSTNPTCIRYRKIGTSPVYINRIMSFISIS